jgi:hypothetical protein
MRSIVVTTLFFSGSYVSCIFRILTCLHTHKKSPPPSQQHRFITQTHLSAGLGAVQADV